MTILNYLNQVKEKFDSGNATEHSYRPALENYLKSLYRDEISVTNEPKRQTCGSPDFIISKKLRKIDVPVGYIEAKDIGKNLDDLESSDQLKRYKESLDNLIFTDYLDFVFYKSGKQYERVKIAQVESGTITFLSENFSKLENLLQNFILFTGQNITSSKDLAIIMAKKAKLMSDSFLHALRLEDENIGIKQQLKAFKDVLIHDITPEKFANMYAQTITYGLFTARYHDETLEDFSREESYDLIPKNNPFLRQLFRYVAVDIEDEIKWAVNELCEVFRHADVKAILNNFGKSSGRSDPIIHFYEDFLREFDPEVRKSRGVWYTPEAVVNFIIRAVDHVLKNDFDLKEGIADKSKIKIKREISGVVVGKGSRSGGRVEIDVEVHKVQMLDVATGTGTFIAEVIRQIYQTHYQGQEGLWSTYAEEDLLPRLHGFEILMASYAMCHLKIDLLLKETGYKPKNEKNPQRLGVYLSNALEEVHKGYDELFAHFLANESKEASRVKKETPVMVAFGNPPYSGVSMNNVKWINDLVEDYKFVNGKHFNERKHWLGDDYVKFIRFSQHLIEKNGEGVVALINPHGFLDNPTFRGMRWHLLKTFDKIYTIDLHGNSKKKETAPDGSKDENVFDIQQGVSINVFVKTGKKKSHELAQVLHFDLFGKRKEKYQFLFDNSLISTQFTKLEPQAPMYFFVPKNFDDLAEYGEGFKVNELFVLGKIGICTQRDNVCIQPTKQILENVINDLVALPDEEFRNKYKERKDGRDWKVSTAKRDVISTNKDEKNIREINYRIFDKRWTYYTNKSKGFMSYPRYDTLRHLIRDGNCALVLTRQIATKSYNHAFVTDKIFDQCFISNLTKEGNYCFPLYLYHDQTEDLGGSEVLRKPNLNPEIVVKIAQKLGLKFIHDHESSEAQNKENFSPLDLLDYIYAILYSPKYREKYKEFLKIDFPRVPYPQDAAKFWRLVTIGSELRKTHLLEEKKFDGVRSLITKFPIAGSNKVETINAKSFIPNQENKLLGKVHINKDQYFDNVPLVAWEFYIGGYQPAQKWLKDRKDRELTHDDILHYQKIILALSETDRLMIETDNNDLENQ